MNQNITTPTTATPVPMTPVQIKMKELKEATDRRQAEIHEKLEMKRVEKQLEYVASPAYETALIAQAKLDVIKNNIGTVSTMMKELEKIPSESFESTGEIKVRSYPIGTQHFGHEIGNILGLLTTLNQLFIDKQVSAAFNIVPSSIVEVQACMNAFGKAAYYNKTKHEVIQAEPGDLEQAKLAISAFADSIGCEYIDMSKMTQEAYEAFYSSAETKAKKKKEQIDAAIELENQAIESGEGRTTISAENI